MTSARSSQLALQRSGSRRVSAPLRLLVGALLLLLCAALVAVRTAHADCRQCCSPQDRPFCCPREATCVQKSSRRFACRMAYGQGGGTTDAGTVHGGGYYDEPVCGFGCVLAITLALCFCLPCCCFLAYRGYQRRQRSLDEQEAAAAAAGGFSRPPPSYPPPVSYATYGGGPSGWASGDAPRAPPNSPAAGYFGSGSTFGPKQWEGPAYHMDEGPRAFRKGGEVPYTAPTGTAFPSSSGGGGGGGSGAQPTIARSPPPREGMAARPPLTTTEQSRSWLASSGAGHEVAEPEAVSRPPAYAPPPTTSAPGGIVAP